MKYTYPLLAPSILAADFSRLGDQINTCKEAGAKWIHCDIMDGHFVPNISYGPDIVKAAGRNSDLFTDVHLMIENPDFYIESFVNAGVNLLTVHQETCPHLHRTIEHIKNHDIKAGVALNPATPVQSIIPILGDVDLVLIMSVNPGFGGQSFIKTSYDKIQELDKLRRKKDRDFLIEIDGGVGLKNAKKIAAAGVDVLVAGSSVFKAEDISGQIKTFNDILSKKK